MSLQKENKILTYLSLIWLQIRAFSDLFGKFLVPMKFRKNCVILGQNMTIFEKKIVQFLAKLGKFTS